MPFPAHALTHAGRTLPIETWAAETRIPAATLRSRLFRLKWPVAKALTAAPDRRFRKGGRKKAGMPRACPELKRHADGRAYCEWSENSAKRFRSFGPWGSDTARDAYRRFQFEWAARADTEPQVLRPTVGTLIVRWLAHCHATYRKRDKPTSEVHCNRAAMRPLAELYGTDLASEFGAKQLRAVREAMVARGWVRNTVNAQTRRIVRAFAWAATERLAPVAVHQELALVEPLVAGRRSDLGEGEPVEPAPEEHVAAVLKGQNLHPDPKRRAVLAAMVRVQLLTGMRPGELCGLRADQIDRTKTPWRYEVTAFNKMLHRDTRRVVFFGPKARAILTPFVKGAKPERVFRLPPARKGAGPTPLTALQYRRFVHAACDRAKVPRWSPNQLRHNRATEVMDRYEDDAAVGAVLGNSAEVARQVYASRAGETVARRIAEATG